MGHPIAAVTQIVIFPKILPVGLRDWVNFKVNLGSLKTVSRKFMSSDVINPIGLNPIQDVIVAGYCDKLLISTSDCFSDGG